MIGMNIGQRAGFSAPGMVNEELGITSKFLSEQGFGEKGDTIQIKNTIFFQAAGNSFTNILYIGDRAVMPQGFPETFLCKQTNMAVHMLRNNIHGHFSQK